MCRTHHNLLFSAAVLALLTTSQVSGMVVPPSVDGPIPGGLKCRIWKTAR